MDLTFILIVGLGLVAMMFFSSRQRKKQQQQMEQFANSLEPGTEVATRSGLLGTVVESAGIVVIETTPGVYTRWAAQAVTTIPPNLATPVEEDEEDTEYDGDDYADDANSTAEDQQVVEIAATDDEPTRSDDKFADYDVDKYVSDPGRGDDDSKGSPRA